MASSIDYETIRHLCGELLDLDEPARDASLADLAKSHPDLHAEIASILTACEWTSQTDFLEPPSETDSDDDGNSTDAPPPLSIPGYDIQRELGRGASGTVYLARSHHPIERQVAIKVLGPHAGTAGRDRFIAERRTLATFNHPHIAQIYDAGVLADDRPWVAIEHVEGRSITRFAREEQLDWRRRVELLVQVCKAVQEVHRKGMVHGDLKPSNILISEVAAEPTVKLVDFGSVMIVDDQEDDGAIRIETTLGYAAPERLTAAAPDPESDIFSLGVLLFEVIVGHHPLDGLPPQVRLRSLASGEIPTAALRRPLPAAGELRSVIQRCCEPAPARRYRTAGEVGDELRRVLAVRPVLARRRSGLRTTLFAAIRRPLLAGLIATTAILTPSLLLREWQAQATLLANADRERATLAMLVDDLLSRFEHQSGRIEVREMLATTVLNTLADMPLAESDPQLIRYRILATQTLGSILLERGDVEASRSHRITALRLIERIMAESPMVADLTSLHRTARILIGDTSSHEGDPETALTWYLPVHEELHAEHERHPEDTDIALSLGWSHRRLASAMENSAPVDAAMHVAVGLVLANDLRTAHPQDPRFHHLLGSLRLWEARLATNPLARLRSSRQAVDAASMADELDPNRWARRSLVLESRIRHGHELIASEQPDAVPFAQETLDLAIRFMDENPDERTAQSLHRSARFLLDQAMGPVGESEESD